MERHNTDGHTDRQTYEQTYMLLGTWKDRKVDGNRTDRQLDTWRQLKIKDGQRDR